MIKKITKAYAIAVLDFNGCFAISVKGYPYFKIRIQQKDPLRTWIMESCLKLLKINYKKYFFSGNIELHIANKKNIEKLVRIVRNECLIASRSVKKLKLEYEIVYDLLLRNSKRNKPRKYDI